MVSTSASAFHSTNWFFFPRHNIRTNSMAPFSAYEPTIPRIALTKGSLSKCQPLNSLRWPIYVFNSVDNTKLPCYTLPPTQHHSFFRKLPPMFIWLIPHSFAALTRLILFLPLEHTIHVFSLPCTILYISTSDSTHSRRVCLWTRKPLLGAIFLLAKESKTQTFYFNYNSLWRR